MKMLIGGEWIDKTETMEVRSPYDGALVGTVPRADEADVDAAVASAKRGAKAMRALTANERSQILKRASELIAKNTERMGDCNAREVGKVGGQGEPGAAVAVFDLAAGEARQIHGETIPFDAEGVTGRVGYYTRVPVGVIASVTPFNYPLYLASLKLAPAFAAGNAVVLKPASQTPLGTLVMAECILEAGLPPEALSVITGPGGTIGPRLVSHPDVRMVTFTGSAEVGKEITRQAGLKKMSMELGANCPAIIMADGDVDAAVERMVDGGYSVAGQVCIAVQRIIVEKSVYDEFIEKFVPKVKALVVGDPLDSNTTLGPMISESAAERAESWINAAVAQGAKALLPVTRKGSLLWPNILVDVTPGMKVFSEEAFAPFVTVSAVKDLGEAIALANCSRYGLQAGIYTRDISAAFRAVEELEVGGVIVNDIPKWRTSGMPYGGMKDSGIGREGVPFSVEEMTELKVACFAV